MSASSSVDARVLAATRGIRGRIRATSSPRSGIRTGRPGSEMGIPLRTGKRAAPWGPARRAAIPLGLPVGGTKICAPADRGPVREGLGCVMPDCASPTTGDGSPAAEPLLVVERGDDRRFTTPRHPTRSSASTMVAMVSSGAMWASGRLRRLPSPGAGGAPKRLIGPRRGDLGRARERPGAQAGRVPAPGRARVGGKHPATAAWRGCRGPAGHTYMWGEGCS
jgi:hypothetical protein